MTKERMSDIEITSNAHDMDIISPNAKRKVRRPRTGHGPMIDDISRGSDASALHHHSEKPRRVVRQSQYAPSDAEEEDPVSTDLDLSEEILEKESIGKDADKKSIKKAQKKSQEKLQTVSKILSIIFAISSAVFLFRLSTTSILPAKYFYTACGVVILLVLISLFIAFKKKKEAKKKTLITKDVFDVILSLIFIFATVKITEVFSFLNKNFDDNGKTYAVYNVVVNKDATFKKLDDLKGHELGTYEELIKDVSDEKLKSAVSEKIPGSTLKSYSDIDELMKTVLDNPTNSILISSGSYESYLEAVPDYESKVKIIGTIEIEVDEEKQGTSEKDLTNTPFLLYISGIDTRTGTMPTRSLSDVNIIAAVNPNTKHILLVSTPRDSYVQLHDTTGLKDKLTHAGTRGGVKLSEATLEDLYGVKMDRYIRVNFNFVKGLVDSIGGVDIDSDIAFSTKNQGGCSFNQGVNSNVNGECALAFARERYSYSSGDRHRGENQITVIKALISKISSGTTILSRYSQILDSLNGTFDSDLSTDDITSLVRMQLNDMASWTTDNYDVNGSGAMSPTYSYPSQNLYVMNLNQSTIDTAKEKINAVLTETK